MSRGQTTIRLLPRCGSQPDVRDQFIADAAVRLDEISVELAAIDQRVDATDDWLESIILSNRRDRLAAESDHC